jgi:hypothetical protein
MLFLHLNLLIQPLESEKLSMARQAEMCKPFSLMWVPPMEALVSHACLNYAESANTSSCHSEHFNDFYSLKEVSHGMKLLSRFFTVGFSVVTGSLNHDAYSTCVSICASTCSKIFILSLTVTDLGFHVPVCASACSKIFIT